MSRCDTTVRVQTTLSVSVRDSKSAKKKYEELHIIVVVLAEDKVLNTSFNFTYR